MGHSAGGAITQILLDRGYGTVGVVLNSAPTEGVRVLPLSQLKSTFVAFKNPANRHRAVPLTHEQWHYAFTNTFSEEESRALYERYAIPASGGILWSSVLANFMPGPQDAAVDYRNDARPPLLFISGGEDHIMPPSVQRSNAKHYKGDTVTEIREYPGYAHLLPAQAGWEEIADYALEWALNHAGGRRTEVGRRPVIEGVRLTHVGGPTVLVEVGGWRLLTDPTFDPPGRRYSFGWGTASTKVAGPAMAAADLLPIDAVLLSHDHHADNLDDAGRALLAGRRHGGHHRRGGAATRQRRRRGSRPWETTTLSAPGRHDDRGDRHPGTARAAAQPAGRRCRRRLRPAVGRPAARRPLDLRATPFCSTASASSPTGCRSTPRCCTWAVCGSRSPGRCATR